MRTPSRVDEETVEGTHRSALHVLKSGFVVHEVEVGFEPVGFAGDFEHPPAPLDALVGGDGLDVEQPPCGYRRTASGSAVSVEPAGCR